MFQVSRYSFEEKQFGERGIEGRTEAKCAGCQHGSELECVVVNDDVLNERESDKNTGRVCVVAKQGPEKNGLFQAVIGKSGLCQCIQDEVEKKRNRRRHTAISNLVEEGIVRYKTM